MRSNKDIREGNLKNDPYGVYSDMERSEYSVIMEIQYYNDKGITDLLNCWYTGYPERSNADWKSSGTSVEINENCKHLMKMIEKSGVLDDTHRILSEKEMEELEEQTD